jgi:iron(III)-enterobactin esterase
MVPATEITIMNQSGMCTKYFLLPVLVLLLALGAARLGAIDPVWPGLDWGKLPPREIRVYLPTTGVTPTTPVLVALDGQNMPAWRLEETLAALAMKGQFIQPLVVAVAAGPDRVEEYGLAGWPDYAGRGRQAEAFQGFVVTTLLPAVRSRYGVNADRERTGIMGSSLGGLAAFDLAWRHPETFGFAGIFSGSFWWRGDNSSPAAQQASRLAHRLVRETTPRTPPRFFLEAGTRDETDDRDGNGVIDAIQDTTELIGELERRGYVPGPNLRYLEIPGGEHRESTWAQALPGFLEWALPRSR